MSDVWLNIVMVVVFVLIGGVFSGAEIALVSLRESQVRAMAEKGRRGQAVQKLLSDPNQFLAAVQVGVTFAGFFSAAFGASTLSRPFADWLVTLGVSEGVAGTLALVLVTLAISYLSLVAGELTPKRLALQRVPGADGWARKLHEAGLMCVSWPKEYGGRGLGGVEVAVLNEEFARVLGLPNDPVPGGQR